MEQLLKPYTEKERSDFIVEYNHNKGFVITEDENGIYANEPEIKKPTYDEIKTLRAEAYKAFIDPITAHIERLKDEDQTADIISEIDALKQERLLKVADIKQKYVYPEV